MIPAYRDKKIPVQSYWHPTTKTLSHQTITPDSNNPEMAAWASIMGSRQPELLVEIMKDSKGEDIGFLPTRGNATDAGLDFYAAEEVTLYPIYQRDSFESYLTPNPHMAIIRTGVKAEIPPGMCLLLWDRSGLSAKNGIHRLAGVIDDVYRGEIKVALINLSQEKYIISRGDKIIQGILQPMILPTVRQVNSLSSTERGEKGFGSTGK